MQRFVGFLALFIIANVFAMVNDPLKQQVATYVSKSSCELSSASWRPASERTYSFADLIAPGNLTADNKHADLLRDYFFFGNQIEIPTIRRQLGAVYRFEGGGSGVLISTEGHLLSAGHVGMDLKGTAAILSQGKEIISSTVHVLHCFRMRFGGDDLAVLQIPELKGRTFAKLATRLPKEDEIVFLMGYPELGASFPVLEDPLISVGRFISYRKDYFLSEDPLNHHQNHEIESEVLNLGGNSGGPLLNEDGEIIGIAVAGNGTPESKPLKKSELTSTSLDHINEVLKRISQSSAEAP